MYAKHLVALAIKQMMHLTDRELAEFLSKSEIKRLVVGSVVFDTKKKRQWQEMVAERFFQGLKRFWPYKIDS